MKFGEKNAQMSFVTINVIQILSLPQITLLILLFNLQIQTTTTISPLSRSCIPQNSRPLSGAEELMFSEPRINSGETAWDLWRDWQAVAILLRFVFCWRVLALWKNIDHRNMGRNCARSSYTLQYLTLCTSRIDPNINKGAFHWERWTWAPHRSSWSW